MSPSAARAAWPAGLALAALLAIQIQAPWRYIHDDNGAWTQSVASAHLRAGLARTRGQDFMVRRSDGALVPYLHHPPLYPLVAAAVYAATGESGAMVTRLVPALAHVAGFAGMAVLVTLLFPLSVPRRAIALWTYALVPMSSFFGKNAFNEPLGLCAIVWALALLARWRVDGSRTSLGASLALWALACFTSWPAFALLGAFAVGSAFEARRGGGRARGIEAAALAAVGALSLGLVLGQLRWAGGGSLAPLATAGGYWGSPLGDPGALFEKLGAAFDMHRRYFANVPFLAYLAWLTVPALRSSGGERDALHRAFVLAGSAGALAWALVFLPQVALHGYGQFWFLPFEALAAADAAVSAWALLAGRPRLRALLAAIAIAGTLGSTAAVLAYRYTHPHGYAIRAAAEITSTYYTRPTDPGAEPAPEVPPRQAPSTRSRPGTRAPR